MPVATIKLLHTDITHHLYNLYPQCMRQVYKFTDNKKFRNRYKQKLRVLCWNIICPIAVGQIIISVIMVNIGLPHILEFFSRAKNGEGKVGKVMRYLRKKAIGLFSWNFSSVVENAMNSRFARDVLFMSNCFVQSSAYTVLVSFIQHLTAKRQT